MLKNMKLFLAVIIMCACVVFAQRSNRRPVQPCITPENYRGSCVVLSYCPQVVNVFRVTDRQSAERYIYALQRSCGTRNINGDPVVCCTRPVTTQQPSRTTASPVTEAPNPFLPSPLPTALPQTENPFFPNQGTTSRPRPAQTTTITTTTEAPVSSAPLIDNKATYCNGPDVREGVCISLANCDELIEQLYAKQNDATFANFLRASNRICGGTDSIVCCPSSAAVQITTAGPIITRNTNEIPRRPPTVQEGCGRTTNSYKKIVGGEVSKKGAWPWIALIGYDDDLSASPFKCGGTLVTARHVVTAAHCLRNDLSFVRLGEHDLSTDTEARHIDIKVVRRESHPEYDRRNGRSDVALLYLEQNVQFTELISAICLPTSAELRQKSYVSFTPFVVGWGKTMEGGTSASVLQELQIPVYENEECRKRYQKQNRVFSANQFDAAVICAGVLSGGKDTCQGDSGGPLMIPEPYQSDVRYYLIGVVSYGIGCARPDVPGVYSSVQFFIDWIVQKIADTQ